MPEDFIFKYLVEPIFYSEGYNPINTTAYAFVLVIAAYLVFKFLKKLNVKIDRKLAFAVAPYVVIGSLFRVLYDAGFVASRLFVTPSIYFLVFAIAIITLFVSLYFQRKFKVSYHKIMFIVGLSIASFAASLFQIRNFYGAVLDIAFFIPWIIIFYFVKWNLANKVVASVQMFDATTTFTSLQFFNYREQHVVPNLFISLFSPASFIVVKLVAVLVVLVLIDKYSEDKEFANYLKLVIGILGAATSMRDFIRLAAFV